MCDQCKKVCDDDCRNCKIECSRRSSICPHCGVTILHNVFARGCPTKQEKNVGRHMGFTFETKR